MFQRQKRTHAEPYTAPITIRAAGGALQRTFSPEVVSTYRQMVTELSYASQLPSRVAIASALQGEGVTHTALALGAILANDTSSRICVVDLNWWRPGMITCLDPALNGPRPGRGRKPAPTPSEGARAIANGPGSAQVAAGMATIDDVLLATELPNLSLIPAGEIPLERRPALARSAKLREAVEELAGRFDHLFFDLPALLDTSDAIALASFGEAVCMVVRHGITSTSNVQQALDRIKHLQMLGVVLNQVSIKTPRWIRALIPQE